MKKETLTIYGTGFLQGIILVSFPAMSALFTSSSGFHLTSSQYGTLFVPQALLSILASLYSSKAASSGRLKAFFLIGLLFNLSSMLFLASSLTLMHHPDVFKILLLATSSLGIGFGLVVPILNTYAAHFFPKKVDFAVLMMNALLGLGTATAPLLVAVIVGRVSWIFLPLSLATLVIVLLIFSFPLKALEIKKENQTARFKTFKWSETLICFVLFAFFYGIVETINGNWAALYMQQIQKAKMETAQMTLTLFWLFVTFGRLLFASLEKVVSERLIYQVLPFLLAVAFYLIGNLKTSEVKLSMIAFAICGLSCSALLPLTISFGVKQLKKMAHSVPGILIGFYLLGYGTCNFGIGKLSQSYDISLLKIFSLASGLALLLGILAFFISNKEKQVNQR